MDWHRVQQVSVDGAPAMMGGQRGFKDFVKRENPSIQVDHCAIHRYSLASKTLPASMKAVFDDIVRIVNFIKSKDLDMDVNYLRECFRASKLCFRAKASLLVLELGIFSFLPL